MRNEVIEKLSALITAALGLVAALAWNSAIQKIFEQLFGTQGTIAAMLFYALIVTVIAVIATVWIGRVSERAKNTTPRFGFIANLIRSKKDKDKVKEKVSNRKNN